MVTDAKDAPLAGIMIRATDVATPTKAFTVVTDETGAFLFSTLPAGSYLVSADTVNTPWIQKEDAPIIQVTDDSATPVLLTLVRANQLMPAGAGAGLSAAQIATLGLVGLSVVGTAITIDQLNQVEDQNAALIRSNSELRSALNALRQLLDERIPASPQ